MFVVLEPGTTQNVQSATVTSQEPRKTYAIKTLPNVCAKTMQKQKKAENVINVNLDTLTFNK